jgi:hypothetical protein
VDVAVEVGVWMRVAVEVGVLLKVDVPTMAVAVGFDGCEGLVGDVSEGREQE